jgi:hypothetical protein
VGACSSQAIRTGCDLLRGCASMGVENVGEEESAEGVYRTDTASVACDQKTIGRVSEGA